VFMLLTRSYALRPIFLYALGLVQNADIVVNGINAKRTMATGIRIA